MIDTQTWLDLLWFHDVRTEALRKALEASRARVVHDAYGLAEWIRLLGYPNLKIDEANRARLIMQFERYSEPFARQPDDRASPQAALPRCRDPDDQPFLQLARDSAAHFLLSRDRALLALDRRCRRVAGFGVVTAEASELQAAWS